MSKPISNSFLSIRMVHLIILILAVSIAVFLTSNYLKLPIKIAGYDALVLLLLLISFSQIIKSIQQNYHPRKVLNISNISTVIFSTVATLTINYFILRLIINHTPNVTFNVFNALFIMRIILVLMIFILGLFIFWIDKETEHVALLKTMAIDKERESIQSELKNLQEQFKPHFLFNSLNSISALTTINPKEAQKMILMLSEFMRGSVNNEQDEIISLSDEIRHIKLYTEIEMIRFGDRLNVQINLDKELKSLKVPKLILQPIMENAIKYGLYNTIGQVTISINTSLENKDLLITTTNPIDVDSQSANPGTGFGLSSIRKKLAIYYGRNDLLTTRQTDQLFITTLRIPQYEKSNNH